MESNSKINNPNTISLSRNNSTFHLYNATNTVHTLKTKYDLNWGLNATWSFRNHFNILICCCSRKHTHTHTHTHIYIYVYYY